MSRDHTNQPTGSSADAAAELPSAVIVGSGAWFGGLVLSGCKEHPHRTDLSCCKIRRPDGSPLSTAETWAIIVQMVDYISALEEQSDLVGMQKAQHIAGLSSPNTKVTHGPAAGRCV